MNKAASLVPCTMKSGGELFEADVRRAVGVLRGRPGFLCGVWTGEAACLGDFLVALVGCFLRAIFCAVRVREQRYPQPSSGWSDS